MKGWWGALVDGAARAFGVAAAPGEKNDKRSKPDLRAMGPVVRHLDKEGVDRVQIARRTGLSQDMVGMLLNLESSPRNDPADSAGSGTFFRILQTRMAS